MKYSDHLRKLFKGIKLEVEDLFLLEYFQISYLPERVPKKEFSVLLQNHPEIGRYFLKVNPKTDDFLKSLLPKYKSPPDKDEIEACCQEALWEIGELIIYNKHPDIYEKTVEFTWKPNEIISEDLLSDKIVIDAGAGTGQVSFLLKDHVPYIYAIEPLQSFRRFMKEKAEKQQVANLFIVDGLLESMPFQDNYADILVTSNAIGWNLEKELAEIERVLKPGGTAIHLARYTDKDTDIPFHKTLISAEWGYSVDQFHSNKQFRIKYSKSIKK